MEFEKVIITKCDLIMNGKAHGITLSDGRKCTAWSDKIDAGMLMQHFANHQPLLAEIKAWGNAEKGGNNIVAIGEDTQPVVMTEKVADAPKVAAPQETHGLFIGSEKDKSIVAQCIVKGAVELCKGETWSDNDELQDFLNRAVTNLSEAYKEALRQLED